MLRNKLMLIALAILVPTLSYGQNACFIRNDSAATTLTSADGKVSCAAVDSKGRLITSPSSSLSESLTDNAPFTDGTSKVVPSGFIYDDIAGTALTENDAAASRIDVKRAQVAVIEDATTRGQRAAVSATGAFSAAGDIANDAADSGNPIKIGARAVSTLPAVITANDRGNVLADINNRPLLRLNCPRADSFSTCSGSDITDTNSTAVKAATGSASSHYEIHSIVVSNSDATVGTRVDILDGATVIWTCPASALFGGCNLSLPTPISGTANTAINAQNSVNSAEVRVCVAGCTVPN